MNLNLPNLPLGVVATKLRASCEPDEYELVGHDPYQIYKGGRSAGNTRVIVEPAPGWKFAYDITRNCYAAAKIAPTATVGEKAKRRYGWKPGLPEFGGKWLLIAPEQQATLPAAHDLRLTGFLPPVYDQGQLGSCTANALAAAIDFERKSQGEAFMTPSRLFIYWNERNMEGTVDQDAGAAIPDGVTSVATLGVCAESEYPYNVDAFTLKPSAQCYADALKFKALSRTRVTQNAYHAKHCIAILGKPIVFGFTVYPEFESDAVAANGVLPMPTGNDASLGGHCVLAVGYDDGKQAFVVRNSWSDSWGDKGYFYMPYSYFLSTQLVSDLNAITLES